MVLCRYSQDGILDNLFGENKNGIVITSLGNSHSLSRNIAIQNDGNILITGIVQQALYKKFTIARFTQDGVLDKSYGENGIIVSSLGEFDDRSFTIAIQNDNKILLAGDSFNGKYSNFGLVRYS